MKIARCGVIYLKLFEDCSVWCHLSKVVWRLLGVGIIYLKLFEDCSVWCHLSKVVGDCLLLVSFILCYLKIARLLCHLSKVIAWFSFKYVLATLAVTWITMIFFSSNKLFTNRTEQYRYFDTLKLLQFLVTLHIYTTIYNCGDKTGQYYNGWTFWYDISENNNYTCWNEYFISHTQYMFT